MNRYDSFNMPELTLTAVVTDGTTLNVEKATLSKKYFWDRNRIVWLKKL